jgi:Ca2+-binding RTX toxin-like protein
MPLVTGTSGNDTLSGGAGDDTIIGLGGNDDLTGGAGNDIYTFNNAFGTDVLREGGGNLSTTDTINVGGLNITGNAIAYNGGYIFGDIFITAPNTGGLLLTRGSDSIWLEEWASNGDYGINLVSLPSGSQLGGTNGNDAIGTATHDSFGNPIQPNMGPGTQIYYGYGGNDTIAAEGLDAVFGGDGNDFISTSTGSTILFGENDNDKLFVGGGNHTVHGGAGDDWLFVYNTLGGSSFLSGGDGNDIMGFYYNGSSANFGNNTFLGGAGDDVFLDPYGHNDTLIGGTGNDLYIFHTSGSLSHGNDVIIDEDGTGTLAYRLYTPGMTTAGSYSYNDTISGTAYQLAPNQWQLTVDDGTFTLSMVGNDLVLTSTINGSQSITIRDFVNGQYGITLDNTPVPPVSITGTSGADTLIGTAGNDTIDGLGGSDTIRGLAGNDSIMGGDGSDTIDGGAGADTIDGGNNSGDVVDYATSNAAVSVNLSTNVNTGGHAQGDSLTSIEKIWTSYFDDTVVGDSNNNYIYDGGGNDQLFGGDGNDSLDGADGADTLDGGNGVDQVDYRYSNAAVNVNLHTNVVSGGYAQGDSISNIENILGSNFNDTLAGSSAANEIDGNGGVDTVLYSDSNVAVTVNLTTNVNSGGFAAGDSLLNIENVTGSAFSDSITGNSSNNIIDGGTGNDTMAGGTGNDTYYVDSTGDVVTEGSGSGTDSVFSTVSYTLGANIENLTLQGAGNLNATGNGSNNALTGNTGNNLIDGGAGNDTMIGGLGDDVYYVDSASDVVTENSGEGTDRIMSSISYTLGSNFENLTLIGSSGISGIGNAVANTIIGNSAGNTLSGGDGNDTLEGAAGGDSLNGGNGTDFASYAGSASAVTVSTASYSSYTNSGGDAAGDGFSSIEGIIGSSGADILVAGNSLFYLDGGEGNDTLYSSSSSDTLDGGNGADRLDYWYSNAAVQVDLSANTVSGGYATGDVISNFEDVFGSDGYNDLLIGSSGNNFIKGRGGADTIIGGAGNDTLDGGVGNDTFDFASGSGVDRIENFQGAGTAGGDVINIVSNVNGSGIVDWATLSANISYAGGNAIIDLGGGHTITLVGVTSLNASDFVIY